MSVAEWTDTYGIHHWTILRSCYRKLAWVGFEPTTTEFHSDALTDWTIRSWVQLALRANFVQLLQFHFCSVSDFILAILFCRNAFQFHQSQNYTCHFVKMLEKNRQKNISPHIKIKEYLCQFDLPFLKLTNLTPKFLHPIFPTWNMPTLCKFRKSKEFL